MKRLIIDEERCKGCALCTASCPRDLLSLSKDRINSRGFHPAEISDQELCISCAMCARMCPDVAITVKKP